MDVLSEKNMIIVLITFECEDEPHYVIPLLNRDPSSPKKWICPQTQHIPRWIPKMQIIFDIEEPKSGRHSRLAVGDAQQKKKRQEELFGERQFTP